jgi:hypothetical protein
MADAELITGERRQPRRMSGACMSKRSSSLRVWSRGQSYGVVAGVIAGMLFAGLAVPLAFGTDPQGGADELASSSSAQPGQATSGASLAPVPGASAAPGAIAPLPSLAPVGSGGRPGAPAGTAGGVGTSSSGGTTSGGSAKLTASDRGVTPTTIKLGVVLLDLSTLTPLGLGLDNYELETQRKIFDTFIAQANKSGDFHGRKITPVYAVINPLDSNGDKSAQAVCLHLIKDEKVFAVTGFAGAAGTCAAVQFQTPSVASGADVKEAFTKSHGNYISGYPSMERICQQWAGWLASTGIIKGKKIGIFGAAAAPESTAGDALEATLKTLGYPTTYRSRLQDQSQVTIEVTKMKQAGVDTVLFPTNFVLALQFVQTADDQNYHPQYMVSDIGNLNVDGLVNKMSRGFDGAIGVTTGSPEGPPAWGPEPAPDAKCRTSYNAANDGKDFARGEISPIGPACLGIQLFARGVHDAGPTLTRPAFVSAIERIGPIDLPAFARGSFRPGKTDFADTVRPMKWAYSCRCYHATGAPVMARY